MRGDSDRIDLLSDMPKLTCQVCLTPLVGRQRRFCSRLCKNADTNNRHQNYPSQGARGLRRKVALVMAVGGKCVRCGYHKNLAALSWHHRDPKQKSFELDLRNLSNRAQSSILSEVAKCELLCTNCHAETHFPQCDLARLMPLQGQAEWSQPFQRRFRGM